MADTSVLAESKDPKVAGVRGENTGGGGYGVWGFCNTGHGVNGDSVSSRGVAGTSRDFHGVFGTSVNNVGVAGESRSATLAGVFGTNASGGPGLAGNGKNGFGVWAHSDSSHGVFAESTTGIGVYAKGGQYAGYFEGNVVVTGDLSCPGADFAEDFDVSCEQALDAGTVMVLDTAGALSESQMAYDHRVAGVISGAGTYRPGIVLDRRPTAGMRQPIALMGKVFCKVDAQFGAIGVGDLLTSSSTPGHAMRTTDPTRAFGAVIGKALAPHEAGRGLIPILVSLQ